MGSKVAPATDLVKVPLQVTGLPANQRTDGVRFGLLADYLAAEQMIVLRGVVPQEQRRFVVAGHKNVHRPIVIEIADGHSASRYAIRENFSAFRANVLQP